MPNLLLRDLDEDVIKLIYDKQAELKKEKLRCVSITQTVEVLLKDAYLRKKDKSSK